MREISAFLRRYIQPPFLALQSWMRDDLGINADYAENIAIVLFLITISSPVWVLVIAVYSAISNRSHGGAID